MKPRILVVDDEQSMREFLQILLEKEGYEVALAPGGEEAIGQISKESFDLVISDVRMPKVTGVEVLKYVKQNAPDTTVIMITAFASMDEATEAIRLGAYHYITKPFKVDEINHIVRNAVEKRELAEQNILLRRQLQQRYSFSKMIGSSIQMLEIYDMIKRVAPTRTNVLIMGESGTGKELAAEAIHFNSPRKDRPFVTINCGAIPENLIESELFGHKKGSFTGAIADTKGLLAQGDGGTIFFDEIGELPFQLQVKLLRAIQERRFLPIGSTKYISVDVRIISATNRDLEKEVARGRFREDLYYRLNVISFRMPPLREHPEDVPMLAEYFLERFCQEQGKSLNGISQEALNVLLRYPFPGNVRELENLVERAVAFETKEIVLVDSLPEKVVRSALGEKPLGAQILMPPEGLDLNTVLEEFERDLLLQALKQADGVKIKAAKLLNISFRSLRYRLAKFGFDTDENDVIDPGEGGQ